MFMYTVYGISLWGVLLGLRLYRGYVCHVCKHVLVDFDVLSILITLWEVGWVHWEYYLASVIWCPYYIGSVDSSLWPEITTDLNLRINVPLLRSLAKWFDFRYGLPSWCHWLKFITADIELKLYINLVFLFCEKQLFLKKKSWLFEKQ